MSMNSREFVVCDANIQELGNSKLIIVNNDIDSSIDLKQNVIKIQNENANRAISCSF